MPKHSLMQPPQRRSLYRQAKRTLSAALIHNWTGTRVSLEHAIRAFLRGKRRHYLLRVVRQHAFAIMAAAALLTGTTAHASSAIELSDIAADLNAGGFVINGEAAGDLSGYSVSAAGDVNGDGLADLIIGAPYADPFDTQSGRSYVVFGKTNGAAVDLSAIASSENAAGFAIDGGAGYDYSGRSVSGAGDVNGDGFDDLVIGADRADANGDKSGRAFVVFGKNNGSLVTLATIALGQGGGFVINGESMSDNVGISVSGAGDVNGDGKADLIVGAVGANANGAASGKSYVVFGKTSDVPVELSEVALSGNDTGFVIEGEAAADYSGFSVSGAGDVNGDDLDDLIVGASGADPNGIGSGISYVIFGKTDGAAVSLQSISTGESSGGFAIEGESVYSYSGTSVSGAGDVNGDGLDDVIVGAFLSSPNGGFSGKSYVVFGRTSGTVVQLSSVAVGIGGFAIRGETGGDYSGRSVSGAGDVNGDGLDDVIVGAYGADSNGAMSGKSYVIFGKTSGIAVQLSTVASGTGGFVIRGEAAGDYSGFSVSGAGDVDGDNLDDLIVGAYGANANGAMSGKSYVIFSPETRPMPEAFVDFANDGEEDGTELKPFNTLNEALLAVDADGTITLDGSSTDVESSETLIIDQSVTLMTSGGAVRIGVTEVRAPEANPEFDSGFISRFLPFL